MFSGVLLKGTLIVLLSMHAILGWVWQLLVNENANGEIEKKANGNCFQAFYKEEL